MWKFQKHADFALVSSCRQTDKTTFDIVDDGKLLRTLTEEDLKNIAVKNKLTKPIGDTLPQ